MDFGLDVLYGCVGWSRAVWEGGGGGGQVGLILFLSVELVGWFLSRYGLGGRMPHGQEAGRKLERVWLACGGASVELQVSTASYTSVLYGGYSDLRAPRDKPKHVLLTTYCSCFCRKFTPGSFQYRRDMPI